jgi:PAS domain S-box-containing protein
MNVALDASPRIVIVDDDPLELKLQFSILRKAGYQVNAFQSAVSSLAQIPLIRPDMVLLDVQMDEMNGVELCQKLKQIPEMSNIPIIFVTGATDTAEVVAGFEAGAVDYIPKPVRQAELLARVGTHLTLSNLQKQLIRQNRELKRQALIFANISDAVILTDLDGAVIDWNPAAEHIFGYTRKEILGKYPRILHLPASADSLQDAIMAGVAMDGRWNGEVVMICRDGSERIVEVTVVPLLNEDGTIVGTIGLNHDVTENRKLLDAVLRGKKEWEASMDALVDMVVVTDADDYILRCNQATSTRVGKNFSEILNMPVAQLFYGETSTDTLRETTSVTFPLFDGVYDVKCYLVQEDDLVQMKVFIVRDITINKQLEAALVASQKWVGVGTLVAGVAHEMNSPLQTITGILDSLLRRLERGDVDIERFRHNLTTVKRNSWRVAEIIRALLTYVRAPMEKMEPQDLNSIIWDALLLLDHQVKDRQNIDIRTQFADDLPVLICDRNGISQVLINLLTNAMESMPSGGVITVRTFYLSDAKSAAFEIEDNGAGMPVSIQPKIFDPFFTTKPLGEGMGLGLSVVWGIIKAHGGEIKVQSSEGVGSSFRITLPLDVSARSTGRNVLTDEFSGRFDDSVIV